MKDGGYLMIDHRASPGLPEDIARQSGLDPKHCGEGKLFEAATLTCSHCKCSVVKNPLRTREREFCMKCYHYICDLCAAQMRQPDYQHLPFQALVDGVAAPLGSPPKLILPDEAL
jgi:hypothetical protein